MKNIAPRGLQILYIFVLMELPFSRGGGGGGGGGGKGVQTTSALQSVLSIYLSHSYRKHTCYHVQ